MRRQSGARPEPLLTRRLPGSATRRKRDVRGPGPTLRPKCPSGGEPTMATWGSVEDDHAARDLARPHGGEALVDVLQRVGAADELIQLQTALHVEVDEDREVDVRTHGWGRFWDSCALGDFTHLSEGQDPAAVRF